MGPIWGRQDPVEPHVSPMNFAIWAKHQLIALDYTDMNMEVQHIYVEHDQMNPKYKSTQFK